MCAALAEQEPWWKPGSQHGYHPLTYGFLVGEVIRRVSGRTVGEMFREDIAQRLDVDYHIGLDLPDSDRFHTQVFMIAMNRDAYQSLPIELQEVIDRNSGHGIAQWLATIWMDNEEPGIKLARESGELILLPREDALELRRKLDTDLTARWVASMQVFTVAAA